MPVKAAIGTPITPTATSTTYTTKILGVPYHGQEQTNWCWAACCQMTIEFLGLGAIRQCAFASAQFGGNCCAVPSSSLCNQPAWPDATYNRHAVRFAVNASNVAFAIVQSEIDAGHPLHSYYAWRGGGAHIAVIHGYYDNGDLAVHDPWYRSSRRTYANVLSAYGLGMWTMTYTGIRT